MTQPIYTDLRTVMGAAQAWLASYLDWSIERVAINDPDVITTHFQAEQYVIVWFGGSRIEMKGGGRADTWEYVDLTFTLRTRLALDDPSSGLIWLADAAMGHATVRHQMLDALTDHVLKAVDPDGNWLTANGLKPTRSPKIRRGVGRKSWNAGAADSSWGESTLAFSADYRLAFTTPYVPW